jgi:hypothetical protein
MRLGREQGGGWLAGKAGLQRSGTGGLQRRRLGPVDVFEAESQYENGGMGREVGVCRTDMRLGRERGGGWSAGKAGLQCSGTERRRLGPVDVFEAESRNESGGLGREVGVCRTGMRLGRERGGG